MKIKLNNIFNSSNLDKKELEENIQEDTIVEKKRRKGAYIDDTKNKKININFKKYFDNLFRNKGKLSKGYYILLFLMLALGGISVAITAKSYNLFAKEDYELYASSDNENSEEDEKAISTISEVESVDKVSQESTTNKSITNSVDASVVNSNKTQNKTTTTTVKPLSFSKPITGEIQKLYSIDKVVYSKTLELWKTHDGIDISADIGNSVKSIEKGTVEKVYEDSFYGVTIVIDHGQGYKSSYSNLDKNTSVKVKQSVKKGQVIGKVSNTAMGEIKDDPHLHFTLFKDNNNVDPTYIFN